MSTRALRIAQLQHEIAQLPEDKLQEAVDYIELLLQKAIQPQRNIAHLRGIWAGKGFEKLQSIEEDLRIIRAEAEQAIERKAG